MMVVVARTRSSLGVVLVVVAMVTEVVVKIRATVVVMVVLSARNYCEKSRRIFHRRHSDKSCR